MLLQLAVTCRRGERSQLSYRDWKGNATDRCVDPYRLVHTERRWYFVARDVARGEWRTFRADRVDRVRHTGQPVELIDPPDPALLVSRSVATGPYPLLSRIRLPLPMGDALRLIPSTVGTTIPKAPMPRSSTSAAPTRTGLRSISSASPRPCRSCHRIQCDKPCCTMPVNSTNTTRTANLKAGQWHRNEHRDPVIRAASCRTEGPLSRGVPFSDLPPALLRLRYRPRFPWTGR